MMKGEKGQVRLSVRAQYNEMVCCRYFVTQCKQVNEFFLNLAEVDI